MSQVPFTLDDLALLVPVVGFEDQMYRALLTERLSSGGSIVIPFDNYFSVSKTITGSADTVAFNVATQTLRPGNYNENSIKVINDISTTSYYTSQAGVYTPLGATGIPDVRYQYLVNQRYYPSWPCNVEEALALTMAAFDGCKGIGKGFERQGSFDRRVNYQAACFAFCQAFKQHNDESYISGMDTRGSVSGCQFVVSNMESGANQAQAGSKQCQVFACVTSTLEVTKGQNVVLVF